MPLYVGLHAYTVHALFIYGKSSQRCVSVAVVPLYFPAV